jgi:hypothetical protein
MKTRERLKRFRQSKSWTEKKALAGDHLPGTRFDRLIILVLDALRYLQDHPGQEKSYCSQDGTADVAGLARDTLQAFGHDFALAVQKGNSKLFGEWEKAIDAWHSHEPQGDKEREAVIKFCIPPTRTFTMRSIVAHLCEIGLAPKGLKSREYDPLRKRVGDICADARIKIAGKRGRPKIEPKRPQKAR